VGGREAAARLVGSVVRAERGERDDLGDGETVERLGRVEEVGGGRGPRLGAVVRDDADGGTVVPDDGMRQREEAWPGAARGGDAAERELEDDEVVALVGEEVRARLRGALLHPLGEGGDGAGHRLSGHRVWRLRRRHGGGARGRAEGFRV